MKTLKTITLLTLLILSLTQIQAQTPSCPCKKQITHQKIFVELFWYDYSPCRQGNGPPNPADVAVSIEWDEVDCNGFKTIEVTNFTLHTNYHNWQDDDDCIPANTYTQNPSLPPGIMQDPHTLNMNDPIWLAFTKYYIDLLVPKPTGTGTFVSYEKGCHAVVYVQWPPNSVIYVSNGDLGGSTTYPLSSSIMIVPCDNSTCCIYEILPNNQVNTITQGDCSQANFPNPFTPTISTTNPVNGQQFTYNGTLIGQANCVPACVYDPTIPQSFTTDLDETAHEISNLILYPTLAKDLIYLKNVDVIKNIQIYDGKGALVSESDRVSNEINITHLNKGIYFIRIEGRNSNYRYIKIIKQ